MIPKLFLFDGPPGAGKSSLSQFLAEQLLLNHYETHWITEEVLEKRFFSPFMAAFEQQSSHATDVLLTCWRALVQEITTEPGIFLIDGAMFANSIKFLLANDTPLNEIERINQKVYALLSPISPWIIYLRGNTETIVRRAITYRGSEWETLLADAVRQYPYQQRLQRTDTDGMVQFFVDSYAFFETILQTCPLRVISFDTTTSDWTTYQTALLKECNCTKVAPAFVLTREQKEKYVGEYFPPSYFPEVYQKPMRIEAQNDGLVLHFSDLKNLVLLPQSKTQFALQGRSEPLEFVLDEQEQVIGLLYPFVTETQHFCKKEQRPLRSSPTIL